MQVAKRKPRHDCS